MMTHSEMTDHGARSDSPSEDPIREARGRIVQIFRFLKALHEHRSPAIRNLGDQPWHRFLRTVPDHPSVTLTPVRAETDAEEGADSEGDDTILCVRRPALTSSPPPPKLIGEWLERGWENPTREVSVRQAINRLTSDGEPTTELFDDVPNRVDALGSWKAARAIWAEAERPAREAMQLFEELYGLWGRMEREAERVELLVGDGILRWVREDGTVHHPVVLQQVELRFDPHVPEFAIVESGRASHLYNALLSTFTDLDAAALASIQREFEKEALHPLRDEVNGFLRSIVVRLDSSGRFIDSGPNVPTDEHPVVGRDPVLFLRSRTLGFSLMIDRIIDDAENATDLPPGLIRIAGLDPMAFRNDALQANDERQRYELQSHEVLLSKEANDEQIEIAQRIERNDAVLVQGPPGTGKTHSIANLIGHFLAQGKTILVTSHTTKALRVLRGHVADGLRELCVAVLGSDAEGREQLKVAIAAIVSGLTAHDKDELASRAEMLDGRRAHLLQEIADVQKELYGARCGEYNPISVGGKPIEPSAAARKVKELADVCSWIRGPLEPGVPLPLSKEEVDRLYQTNLELSLDDEAEIKVQQPDVTQFPLPKEFKSIVNRISSVGEANDGQADVWSEAPDVEGAEDLEECLEAATRAVEFLATAKPWELTAVDAALEGGDFPTVWTDLIDEVDECVGVAARLAPRIVRHDIKWPAEPDLRGLLEVLTKLRSQAGLRPVGSLQLLLHPRWKSVVRSCGVDGQQPRTLDDFRLLHEVVELEQRRQRLAARWDRQMGPVGGPAAAELGVEIEKGARQYSARLRELLDWPSAKWGAVEKMFELCHFNWPLFLGRQKQVLGPHGDLMRLHRVVSGPMKEAFAPRLATIWSLRAAASLDELEGALSPFKGGAARGLLSAVRAADVERYRLSYERLAALVRLTPTCNERFELLEKLRAVASQWAASIEARNPLHGEGEPPGDAVQAWYWRQLSEELDRRNAVDDLSLGRRRDELFGALRETTSEMIRSFAWYGQLERTTHGQRQALVGWADTIRKIGKGTGKRAPRLRLEAQKLMEKARGAVPVWIMPLARVADSFDPRSERFDVVIIDEASQSDVLGLVAFYLGRQVLVVGDHEQVSPVAVGQRPEVIEGLIQQHLLGIPNKHLYDGQTSIYDLARQSFESSVRLVEHFRCVPDIIEFSNGLSYDWSIKPLREPAAARVMPSLVEFHVPDAKAEKRLNRKEAEVTAALVLACCEQPEYENVSMGVISLVGVEQAIEINQLLLQNLDPQEYDRRRVVCGNSAQFQGDERDVMFLSMVDSPADGPLAFRDRPMFRQRFNVAASRARDQMWLVHSLNPATDLKSGDLRRRLIEYVRDPHAFRHAVEKATARTESPFEKAVVKRLLDAGFRVQAQVEVGYYRIDIVVSDGESRMAVECDGDRWHPIEKIPEDMARQATLERMGWRFLRIRGTRFYRDPDDVMKAVIERLERAGINKVGQAKEEPAAPEHTELIERVKRRAFEIMRSWHEIVNTVDVDQGSFELLSRINE